MERRGKSYEIEVVECIDDQIVLIDVIVECDYVGFFCVRSEVVEEFGSGLLVMYK